MITSQILEWLAASNIKETDKILMLNATPDLIDAFNIYIVNMT